MEKKNVSTGLAGNYTCQVMHKYDYIMYLYNMH